MNGLWYTYTMEYDSAKEKNAIQSVLMRWMNLEPMAQGKVSQKEKDKYRVFRRVSVESRKTVLLSLFAGQHWRRKWQPTPVFLPGESQGRGSLVGCRLWGCTESDRTEATQQ